MLKILAVLGAGDRAASENMYNVVQQTLRRANSSHTIGNAIIYECVQTITSIYPNPSLLASGAPLPQLPRTHPCPSSKSAYAPSTSTLTIHACPLNKSYITPLAMCMLASTLACPKSHVHADFNTGMPQKPCACPLARTQVRSP